MLGKLKYDWKNPIKHCTNNNRGSVNEIELLRELQEKLNYNFEDVGLLHQAITHQSAASGLRHMRPMDFLGDAMLKLAISSYLYGNIDNLTSQRLNDKRSQLECNKAFAFFVARSGLHKFFRLSNYQLRSEIEHYAENVSNLSYSQAKSYNAPKPLADLFESIAAAIYMDSDLNEQTVWECYKPFIQDRLEEEANS